MDKKTLTIDITTLKANPHNPRVHSPKQVEEIIKSYKQFGQFRPVVCDENNMILAGHGLHEAMVQAGCSEIEVVQYTNLDDQMKKKLLLADNKTQSLGKDDFEKITEIIREIDDYEIPGYDDDILDVIRSHDEEDEEMVEQQNETFEAEYSTPDDVDSLESGSIEEPEENNEDLPVENESPKEKKTIPCPHCGEPVCLP